MQQTLTFLSWMFPPLILCLGSVLFFLLNRDQKNIYIRLSTSLHGIGFALLFFVGYWIWTSKLYNPSLAAIFGWLALLFTMSLVCYFFVYKGKKRFLLLYLLYVPVVAYVFLVTSMFTTNVWL